jgi:hypothetical protein
MSQRLPSLVTEVFEQPRPTLEGLDELLAEVGALPRDHAVAGLIDDLLDYRVVLAERVAPAQPSGREHVSQNVEHVVVAGVASAGLESDRGR